MGVAEGLRKARRERINDAEVCDALIVGAQGECLANHLIDVDHRARRLTLARECQQVPHNARGPFRLAQDDFQPAPHLRLERRLLGQALRPRQDRGEWIVEFVRDAGNRLAERGHFLCLEELVVDVAGLVVQFLALAHVPHKCFDP